MDGKLKFSRSEFTISLPVTRKARFQVLKGEQMVGKQELPIVRLSNGSVSRFKVIQFPLPVTESAIVYAPRCTLFAAICYSCAK